MKIIYEPKGKALEYAPLAANIYKGCSHGCTYCYAPNVLYCHRATFHEDVTVREGAIEQLKKDVAKLKGDNRRVLMSFTTDPYQHADVDLGITREAIQIIKDGGLNVEILTKGGLRAVRDLDLLSEGDCLAVTLTLLNYVDLTVWEPASAPAWERIESLKIAKEKFGITTWASMEPVIFPEQTLELIKMSAPFVDLFKVGKLNYHPRAKEIDWYKFGHDAVDLLDKLGKEYYLKMDLRGCMEIEKGKQDDKRTAD